MSLLRPVIRACAVAALRDNTWADNRVYDSDMTPLAEAIYGQTAKPYIVVYTDTDDRKAISGAAYGTEMYNGDARMLSIVIEIGVANAVKGTTPDSLVLQFAATDQGMELAVDVIETQVIAALFGDPHSKWGDIFKRMVFKIFQHPSRRGGQAQHGIRFAARRTSFIVSTIDDIPLGIVLPEGHPVLDFINLAKSDHNVGIVDVANIIEGLLSDTAAPTWRQAQSYLGLNKQAVLDLVPEGAPLPWPEVEVPGTYVPAPSSD